ncbi:hypothetical protein LY90DRAFT_499249 [Neocallimastix californiae]|uniref:Uncharacterized protein n=1 Tax=Neocallimastix californiae TaxID=1754190 RepID=A0A1Y2FKT7_9FUNG|nr:hypothetical protein LY90DRAFT_499249 [Neocallimastix californiae]|eukprot:ORY84539.1 hypothetical protein LY90DRAFT_499249 [Neocallimastix californiae]
MPSNNISDYPTGGGYQKVSSSNELCPPQPYNDLIDGILSKFDESIFYTNILQFALVTLMYVNIGKGRYWKILFYASVAGLLGTFCEKGSVAYLCSKSEIDNLHGRIYGFFIAEIFWIVKEYAIPFLNLTKMKAFSQGKTYKILNIIIYILFVAFIGARFYIGYMRCTMGILNNEKIALWHMVAFSIMAVADLICTIGILYFVNMHNKQEYFKSKDIDRFIKRSSYIILVCVDIVSIILALCNGISVWFKDQVPESIVKPFLNIKCSFILILACDSLLFKYSVRSSSFPDSNNYNYINATNNITNSKQRPMNTETLDINSINRLSSVSPYSYPIIKQQEVQ